VNVNLGGILGLLAGVAVGLLISLPIDTANPDSAGRAGRITAFTLIAGAFAGNILWEQVVSKNKRK
jgi:hypothetical protein